MLSLMRLRLQGSKVNAHCHTDVPRHFLGCNVTVHDESKLSLTMKAHVAQLASKYLPKPLAE